MSRTFLRLTATLTALLVAPSLAAQHAGNAAAPPAAAAAASAAAGHGAPALVSAESAGRLRPLRWLYVASLVGGGGTPQRLGFRTLELSATTFDGTPAWLLVDSREMRTVTLAESLYVARADLAPLRRVQRTAAIRVVSDFAPDSIRTTFATDTSRVAVAMPNQKGIVANVYLLEALLGTTPLRADWRGATRLAAIGENGSGMVPIEEHIVGQEKVLVPDGAFDCWVVALEAGPSEEKFWVRKSDGVVIKERVPVIGMDGSSVELLLALDGVQHP